MSENELKGYIDRMSVEELRKYLLETSLLVKKMHADLNLKNAEMLIEKARRDKEVKELKQNINLN